MKLLFIAFNLYFVIGTFFLALFATGYLELTMINRKTKKELEDPTFYIVVFCICWPFLIHLLWKERQNKEE